MASPILRRETLAEKALAQLEEADGNGGVLHRDGLHAFRAEGVDEDWTRTWMSRHNALARGYRRRRLQESAIRCWLRHRSAIPTEL